MESRGRKNQEVQSSRKLPFYQYQNSFSSQINFQGGVGVVCKRLHAIKITYQVLVDGLGCQIDRRIYWYAFGDF